MQCAPRRQCGTADRAVSGSCAQWIWSDHLHDPWRRCQRRDGAATRAGPRRSRGRQLPTGEPLSITRRRGSDTYTRTMEYDSLGRMVANFEPTGGVNGWRYLYDEAGDLVATSDPRECGVNFAYDRGGRLLSEDYSPCATYHEPYDTNPEVTYEYDDAPTEAATAFSDPTSTGYVAGQDCRNSNFTQGRLVAVTDRAQRSLTCYDGRGRTVEVAKQLVDPSGNLGARWYNRRAAYDGADRPVIERIALVLVSGLFGLKMAWNLAVPYVLTVRSMRTPSGNDEQSKGISLMPAVEFILLAVGVILSWAGDCDWPCNAGGVALYGGAIVVGSYIHLVAASALAGWVVRRFYR